ncbi:2-dehydropantoate 2-reductase [Thermococcus sp. M39]|uniref:ketopantoate reductase family protein n=1 Tax=Thermococcus sp. M39 TaxID=1638262 RepID=UPI001438FDAC|nr:2-dehydropantoate 2-reductase [Thermococcus sp. M39]NJE07645.1 2-dehydropantoate 2-reductase [Thermococcus sp. M39]
MLIYIIGAGAIGSLFGGLLANVGYNVVLIGRKEQVKAINQNGLKITGLTNLTVNVKAYEHPPGEEPDLIILATKAYSTKDALSCVGDIIGNKTWILSIQNGLGNEDLALQYTSNVLGGITTNGATLLDWGTVQWSGKGETIVGVYPKGKHKFAHKVAEVFTNAGIPTRVSENITGVKWAKAIVNSAINPLGALLGVKNGFLVENDYAKNILIEIAEESYEVAKKLGIEFEFDPVELTIRTAEMTKDNYNSMLQDLQRRKRTEINYINGKIVEFASKAGTDAKLNELFWKLIKAKEEVVLNSIYKHKRC